MASVHLPPLSTFVSPSPSSSSSQRSSSSFPLLSHSSVSAPSPPMVATNPYCQDPAVSRLQLRGSFLQRGSSCGLGISVSLPVSVKRKVMVHASQIDGASSNSGIPVEGKEASIPVESLPLELKLQLRLEQKLKMKLAKKIRLRRKCLVRKRRMRKKGRWPLSKMNKNKNV